jgi:predicted acylesterase/phospholipase RssA
MRLAIGPGAMAYFYFLGILSRLDKTQLTEISGASAGGLLAFLLLAARLDVSRVLDYSLNAPIKQLMKPNIKTLFSEYGLVSSARARKIFSQALHHFTGLGDVTFDEFYKLNSIKLHVAAHCLDECKTVYFSVDTHPEMSVLDAVVATISIPFLFTPLKHNGMQYIDGGLGETSPCGPFITPEPRDDILVIRCAKPQVMPVVDFKSFIINLIKSTTTELRKTHPYKTLEADTSQFNVFDFTMNSETKLKMYILGSQTPYPPSPMQHPRILDAI